MKTLAILFLSIVVIAGFFGSSYVVLSGEIKTSDPQMLLLIGTVLGNISTLAGVVVSYWFGSSKGSSDKDKTIADMTART